MEKNQGEENRVKNQNDQTADGVKLCAAMCVFVCVRWLAWWCGGNDGGKLEQ